MPAQRARDGARSIGRRTVRLPVGIGLIGILAFSGGLVYAAIPNSSTGVINGCFERTTGLLRVIDTQAGKSCTRWETPISWSQTGPQGEAGAIGPQGPAGAEGARGPAGPQGPQGERGDAGAIGLSGAPGAAGEDGEQGPQGEPGPQGERGLQGEPGQAGVDGKRGEPGPAGGQGLAGPPGPQGPAGPQGPTGSGVTGWEIVTGARSLTTSHAICPAGKRVLGGGFAGGDAIISSVPSQNPDGWFVSNLGTQFTTAYAICAVVSI